MKNKSPFSKEIVSGIVRTPRARIRNISWTVGQQEDRPDVYPLQSGQRPLIPPIATIPTRQSYSLVDHAWNDIRFSDYGHYSIYKEPHVELLVIRESVSELLQLNQSLFFLIRVNLTTGDSADIVMGLSHGESALTPLVLSDSGSSEIEFGSGAFVASISISDGAGQTIGTGSGVYLASFVPVSATDSGDSSLEFYVGDYLAPIMILSLDDEASQALITGQGVFLSTSIQIIENAVNNVLLDQSVHLLQPAEPWEEYAEGTTEGQALDGGVGLDGSWLIQYHFLVAAEDYEPYSVTPDEDPIGTLNGPYGWASAWAFPDITFGVVARDTFELYAVESPIVSTLNKGFGFNTAWAFPATKFQASGTDSFESYAVESPIVSTLNGGSNFNTAWAFPVARQINLAVDDMESYALGAITGSALTGGTGWATAVKLTAG